MGTAAAQGGDLCSSPHLPSESKHCRVELILYRAHGHVSRAELAQVVVGFSRNFDVTSPILEYFLRDQTGTIIPLGTFGQANNFWANAALHRLLGLGGGIAGVDGAFFYDRIIEIRSGKYCVVYQPKPPFTGELLDCEGNRNHSVLGEIAYSPDIVSLRAAVRSVCSRIEAETSRKCQNNDVGPIRSALDRNSDGSLYYVITLRRTLDVATGRFDYLIYRVEASGGRITHLETTPRDRARSQ